MKIRLFIASIATTLAGALALPVATMAATPAFQLQPFEFVGTAEDCGGTAGTDTVTAEWTNSTGNPAPAILLQKLGSTSNCAAAGVDIVSSLEGASVSELTELNFDYQNGGHCGGGAPRFNVVVDGNYYFLGCNQGVQTPVVGTDWTHVVFGPAEFAAAGIPTTGTLDDVYIIFDEGTDTPAGGTIGTPGTVYIDNISVNNQEVGSPTSPLSKDSCKNDGWKSFNPSFKNQGDCVSYVATHGKNQPSTKH